MTIVTEKIFYEDCYCREFESRVLEIKKIDEENWIRLEKTAFYPKSGGQPSDQGTLNQIPIAALHEENGQIWHSLRRGNFAPGDQVVGRVDWERRFDHMQQHTGQHLLSQAFYQTSGLQTHSFHMGSEVNTIDLDVTTLEADQIYSAEDLAARRIFENRPVEVYFTDRSKLDQIPIRKPTQRTGRIRIVEIQGFDTSACGGTHVRRTGEVGLIKVRKWERVRKKARVEFYCGKRALLDYRQKNRSIYLLGKHFSAPEDQLLDAARQERDRLESLARRLGATQKRLTEFELQRVKQEATRLPNHWLLAVCVLQDTPVARARELALTLVSEASDRIALLGVKQEKPALIVARSENLEQIDLTEWVAEPAALLAGGGGGRPHLIQLGGTEPEGLPLALEWFKKRIDHLIESSRK